VDQGAVVKLNDQHYPYLICITSISVYVYAIIVSKLSDIMIIYNPSNKSQ